jgi:trehalose 6-phosphate synthase/phosphatase
LPFSIEREENKVTVRQSSGGLVSAVKSFFEHGNWKQFGFSERIWMGVADFPLEDWENDLVRQEVNQLGYRVIPLFVEKDLYQNYYNGFSNSVLWPLFHYFTSVVEYESDYFDAYRAVNLLFANRIIPEIREGDTLWIHDYQVLLLPELIRSEKPKVNIGLFLHIPFPSYEIFRLLPEVWKKMLLQGMLGADLIGFHTHDYVQHFMQSVRIILGLENNFYNIQTGGRFVKAAHFPIGIDYRKFRETAKSEPVQEHMNEIRKNFEAKKIIFSVDRLDYTKGVMDRLNGFEYFLKQFPEWKGRVVFILNVIPSRNEIPAYIERKKQIEEKIGAINGKFSSISWQPVIYGYKHLEFNEMCALYQAADVAMITPLRDGMNLVSKEYVASCISQKCVLILSELAGAAAELNEALLVNPIDIKALSSSIQLALTMPAEEQVYRMGLMQQRLRDYDVVKWACDFLEQIYQTKKEQKEQEVRMLDQRAISDMVRHYHEASSRCLLLDYDGTLTPFSSFPLQATPNRELKETLFLLGEDRRNQVVIISGREAGTLDRWFGHMQITLVAEHGASIRKPGSDWEHLVSSSNKWKDEIRNILQGFVFRCVGSFIEEKNYSIAWHYRNAQRELGSNMARVLINNLTQFLQNTMLQVVAGNMVVEVRMSGYDKGIMALKIVNEWQPGFTLCIGDDTTDEDMFKALQNRAYTIKVSGVSTSAKYTIFSQKNVLPLLNQLLQPLPELRYAAT